MRLWEHCYKSYHGSCIGTWVSHAWVHRRLTLSLCCKSLRAHKFYPSAICFFQRNKRCIRCLTFPFYAARSKFIHMLHTSSQNRTLEQVLFPILQLRVSQGCGECHRAASTCFLYDWDTPSRCDICQSDHRQTFRLGPSYEIVGSPVAFS